jgi:hypothetical protein
MKIDKRIPRLRFFTALYERARSASTELSDRFSEHEAQYRGDDRIDGSTERAGAVRNITYEIIETQVSSELPMPKVSARHYSESRERLAKAIERLCTSVRASLPFGELNDIDERYTYILGGSVWLVEWDDSLSEGGVRGGVRISCISPRDFFPQPDIYRVEDMEYCFLRFDTTREELIRRYGVSEETAALAESETAGEGSDGTATVIVCYYRGEDEEVCRFVFSGDAVLEDSVGYYRRRDRDGGLIDFERPSRVIPLSDGGCIAPETPILLGETVVGVPTRLPYYLPREFPIVIRKNTSADRRLFGQSDCEYIRPQQQQINKVESRIMQKLMRAAVTPIVPEDAVISVSNSVFGQVIRLRPGESAAQYGKVDTTPDISQDVLEAERLYDHAKRIIGISDTYQGMDVHAGNMSGYARQLQVSQAAGRLESKRRMKNAAYAAIDRLIFLHYLAFADEVRELAYRDAWGRMQNLTFNRYDFYRKNEADGSYTVDDGYLFSAEVGVASETGREAVWEKNLQNFREGTLGDVSDPHTLCLYWQMQERAHYPYAEDQAEYFRRRLREQEKELSFEQNEQEEIDP